MPSAAEPISRSGYVTVLSAVSGKAPGEIERGLGYSSGILAAGFTIYALTEHVSLTDFFWQDRTRYMDGWHFDPTIGEYVQRRDELRAQLGRQHTYDEALTDAAIEGMMTRQLRLLNVRSGPNRIVKVVIDWKRSPEPSDFVDSAIPAVPQWKLKVPKWFVPL